MDNASVLPGMVGRIVRSLVSFSCTFNDNDEFLLIKLPSYQYVARWPTDRIDFLVKETAANAMKGGEV